ncbi:hypothetical protein THRCLA_22799 [Thraustotheca clavata]|uniref:Uncharacterized protein n=1 Tax=Thraustotheca clavata TaxID=74557 RepID=A0A1V9YSF0_9STRA|nr:hypothetical protein THRCLA_22799 [Thraustotheca clavata]
MKHQVWPIQPVLELLHSLDNVPDWSVKAISSKAGCIRISATSTTLNVAWVANKDNAIHDAFVLSNENTVVTPYPTVPTTTPAAEGYRDWTYASGEIEQWDAWYNQSQNLFSEAIKGGGSSSPSGKKKFPAENYVGYIHRVNNPVSAAQNRQLRTYYSIGIELVHCVFLDDYAGSRGADKPSDYWLTTGVDHKKTPWFSSTTHLQLTERSPMPMWTQPFTIPDAHNFGMEITTMLRLLLLAKSHSAQIKLIDMVVFGHTHGYEGTAPVVKNKIDAKNGMTYMITGAGGHDFTCNPTIKSA